MSALKLLSISFAIACYTQAIASRDSPSLVAWSPGTIALTSLLSQDRTPSEWLLFNEESKDENLCNFDVVAVISHPGMRGGDLRLIDTTSGLYKHFSSSSQNITVSDLPTTSNSDAAESLARRCAAEFLEYSTERGLDGIDVAGRLVLHMLMPPLTGFGRWRKELLNEQLRGLNAILDSVENISSNHAILYTSSPLHQHARRQSDAPPKHAIPEPFAFAAAKQEPTGIFARYQLLTPGLITALLAVFFVILPLVVFAVHALSSIQSSVRLDAPKVVSQDRKSQ